MGIGIVYIYTLDIRVFEISLLQSTDGDGTFISLMAQKFQQDYEYNAFGRMTSATSPLWAVCALRWRVNPRLLRIHPLWKSDEIYKKMGGFMLTHEILHSVGASHFGGATSVMQATPSLDWVKNPPSIAEKTVKEVKKTLGVKP